MADLSSVPPMVPTTLLAALGAAVVSLGGVVAYLFRHYTGRLKEIDDDRRRHDEQIAKERAAWVEERAHLSRSREEIETDLRLEFEGKLRQALQDHIAKLCEVFESARENENEARREYTKNVEFISRTAAEANEKIGMVLERFYDRLAAKRPLY